jgi:multiple antibiotic resistance protein
MSFEEFFKPFLMSFIPIMVAMDAPGILPIFISITEGIDPRERKRILRDSLLTALLITIGFTFLGAFVFNALVIRVEDFMIAGGIILLIIAVSDIVLAGARQYTISPTFGIVPLGTPLIAGPATLTTTLALVNTYGYTPVLFSLAVNILLAWIIFSQSERIIRLIGINGALAFAKVAALLLAAIAVKMIRSGVLTILNISQGSQ